MVKRRTSRIDTVLPVTAKDGKVLRITMTCLTLTRANLSQVHAIRSAMTQFLQSYAAQREFPAFVKDMVSGEITKELFKLVKPIYPVRRVAIITSRVESEEKAEEAGEPAEEKPAPESKPEEEAEAPAPAA
jgi:small subunit ribosomal protein S3Ae